MKKVITICLLVISLLAWCSSVNAQSIKYKGTIGPYEVKVSLNYIDNGGGINTFGADFEGSYTYIKAGNTLKLQGHSHRMTGSDFEEYTPKGVNSASWHLEGNNWREGVERHFL